MIIEYTYSSKDLKKKCYNCRWLQLYDDFNGKCVCEFNKIKFRDRNLLTKACSYKNCNGLNKD